MNAGKKKGKEKKTRQRQKRRQMCERGGGNDVLSHQGNALFYICPRGEEPSSIINIHPPVTLTSCPFTDTHTHTHEPKHMGTNTHSHTHAHTHSAFGCSLHWQQAVCQSCHVPLPPPDLLDADPSCPRGLGPHYGGVFVWAVWLDSQ